MHGETVKFVTTSVLHIRYFCGLSLYYSCSNLVGLLVEYLGLDVWRRTHIKPWSAWSSLPPDM